LQKIAEETQAVWLSDSSIEEKMVQSQALIEKSAKLKAETNLTLASAVKNSLRLVVYEGVLYKLERTEVKELTSGTRTVSVSSGQHKEKFLGKTVGLKHNGQTIVLGTVEHIESTCLQLGLSFSRLLFKRISEVDNSYQISGNKMYINGKESKGISGWSNPALITLD